VYQREPSLAIFGRLVAMSSDVVEETASPVLIFENRKRDKTHYTYVDLLTAESFPLVSSSQEVSEHDSECFIPGTQGDFAIRHFLDETETATVLFL
jgi:hypothetical protein